MEVDLCLMEFQSALVREIKYESKFVCNLQRGKLDTNFLVLTLLVMFFIT